MIKTNLNFFGLTVQFGVIFDLENTMSEAEGVRFILRGELYPSNYSSLVIQSFHTNKSAYCVYLWMVSIQGA